ncbi:hypothetical protein [Herbiconiux sp. L3-i23]|uniref:hypothetical protein n=1 Tax=Herbiconiux sp. L3-i23 TaxID=2905871 RepID=UPI0020734562|nr:hypothetical protein [Herbiconiux sp. L3-i23]
MIIAIAVSASKPSLVRLCVGVGGAQFVYHAIFGLSSHTPSVVPSGGHHGAPIGMLTLTGGDQHADMAWLHVAAAVLTVLYTVVGTRQLDATIATVVRRVRGVTRLTAVVLPRFPQKLEFIPPARERIDSVPSRWVWRRGPPVGPVHILL